jgi:hypothetical protein
MLYELLITRHSYYHTEDLLRARRVGSPAKDHRRTELQVRLGLHFQHGA